MQTRMAILATILAGVAIFSFLQTDGGVSDLVNGRTPALAKVEANIQKRFPEIGHMNPAELAKQLGRSEIVLVDVRNKEEYAVSRLPGAIRMEPGGSLESLQTKLGGREVGSIVLFYCSVGERSSRLAMRAKDQLLKSGAQGVQNLKGGIFRWHNQSRSLVNASGATDYVHPFDSQWGKLVMRQSMTRYEPTAVGAPD